MEETNVHSRDRSWRLGRLFREAYEVYMERHDGETQAEVLAAAGISRATFRTLTRAPSLGPAVDSPAQRFADVIGLPWLNVLKAAGVLHTIRVKVVGQRAA